MAIPKHRISAGSSAWLAPLWQSARRRIHLTLIVALSPPKLNRPCGIPTDLELGGTSSVYPVLIAT
jgi:hypothetical protein